MNLSQVLKVNEMMLHWSKGQAELEISTGNKAQSKILLAAPEEIYNKYAPQLHYNLI